MEQKKVTAKAISFLTDVVTDMNPLQNRCGDQNEVLKPKVELNNSKLFQINIENNIALAKMALNQSIGLGIENPMHNADTTIEIHQN
ncbi:hypothetical protein [Ancylomarina sp. 16SWW S1-10-2]|uniref:hypothetical protein n=1 Tax=Ancylomarina sp. 16SWW S1-10-2 TaxID=2499681 RepID=UPI0012ADF7ED